MNDTPESAARRRTRRLIRQSFITLLGRMPFEGVTVQHLCREADINRATFYRYYPDLYALMEELSDELFAKLFTDVAAQGRPPDGNSSVDKRVPFYQALCIAQENKDLFQALVRDQETSSFLLRIETSHKEVFQEINKPPYRHPEEVDLMLNYIASGLIGLFKAWLQSDCLVPAWEVAKMADESASTIYTIVKRFV